MFFAERVSLRVFSASVAAAASMCTTLVAVYVKCTGQMRVHCILASFWRALPWSAAYTCFCFILIVGLLISLIARIKFVAKSGHMPRHSYAAAVKSSVHIHHGFDNHRILEKTVES